MRFVSLFQVKKWTASISLLVYFAFTCGIMINTHFCMDELDSVRLYAAKSDYCTKCGMHTRDHGCCHDEVRIVKISDTHQGSDLRFSLASLTPVVVPVPEFLQSLSIDRQDAEEYPGHSPPIPIQPDTYLQNCVFRL